MLLVIFEIVKKSVLNVWNGFAASWIWDVYSSRGFMFEIYQQMKKTTEEKKIW